MPNIKLRIAYEGTHYFGWQKTCAGPTIEQVLQTVLEKILQQPVYLQAASRTDLGVHAEGQIVNFITHQMLDLRRIQYSCNRLLPLDIRVLAAEEVPEAFHPTLDNKGKEYHYSICNGPLQLPQNRLYSWHIPQPLDITAMHDAARLLTGELNFKAFCNIRRNILYNSYVRQVREITLLPSGDGRLTISIVGNDFLYKMVRNLVGTLVYVGLQKLTLDQIPTIIRSGLRPAAGITAPAHGLFLKNVFY